MKTLITSIFFLTFFGTVSFAQVNPASCSDLYFSEYIEGSVGNNKAIEIFNPTSSAIDLSKYRVQLFPNGSNTANPSFTLYGMLAAGDVYVIANSQADAPVLSVRDTVSGVANFNGDDAIILINLTTTDTIDIFGIKGNDPGTKWDVGTGSTADHTLVRKASVNAGQLNWVTGATEWDIYPDGDFTHLGSHTMDPCGISANPDVYLVSSTQSVDEGDGTVTVQVGIHHPNSSATSVTLKLSDANAVFPDDFSINGLDSAIVTFPANSSTPQSVTIQIEEDVFVEGNESFVASLIHPDNLATVTGSSNEITIVDNDPTNIFSAKNINAFTIFPNPVKDFCIVSVFESSGILTLTNLLGETMMEKNISGLRSVKLNLKELPYGIYFINWIGAAGKTSAKIIKE